MRALPPSGRCERAADCSDEGALTEKRGFRTRDLIIEKGLYCVTLSEPPRRDGGEPNGSLPRCARIGYSQKRQTNCIQLSRDSYQRFLRSLRSGEMTQGAATLHVSP